MNAAILLLALVGQTPEDYLKKAPKDPVHMTREELKQHLIANFPDMKARAKESARVARAKKKLRVMSYRDLKRQDAYAERARRKARIAAGIPAMKHYLSRTHALRLSEAWWEGYIEGRRVRYIRGHRP